MDRSKKNIGALGLLFATMGGSCVASGLKDGANDAPDESGDVFDDDSFGEAALEAEVARLRNLAKPGEETPSTGEEAPAVKASDLDALSELAALGAAKPGEGAAKPGEGAAQPGEGAAKPGEGAAKPDENPEQKPHELSARAKELMDNFCNEFKVQEKDIEKRAAQRLIVAQRLNAVIAFIQELQQEAYADRNNPDVADRIQLAYAILEWLSGLPARDGSSECAKELLQILIWANDIRAMLSLGTCYLNGSNGIEKNEEEGAGLFKQAADRGEPIGKYLLADCCLRGLGVPQDKPKALVLLREAADAGCHQANLILAMQECRSHPDEAMRILIKCYKAGDMLASAIVGLYTMFPELSEEKLRTEFEKVQEKIYFAVLRSAIGARIENDPAPATADQAREDARSARAATAAVSAGDDSAADARFSHDPAAETPRDLDPAAEAPRDLDPAIEARLNSAPARTRDALLSDAPAF
ncbi:MAG: hypothetical protein LBR89_00670 [Holosporales bacterium]|jgi:hypothetical protein|nr:hypothetical protein [Holosporales bacterium]